MNPRDTQPDHAKQHLPPQQPVLPVAHHRGAAAAGRPAGQSFSWLAVAVFLFLTFNSGMAVYRSDGDPRTLAFLGFSYLDLVALFYCLRRYEDAEPGSRLRHGLKIAVWLLTTAITLLFSFKVAALMPPAVAVVVWLMAFGTVAGGFFALFCYNEKQ
jgi:hypothetical protein